MSTEPTDMPEKGNVDNLKLFEEIYENCKIALLRKSPLYYWTLKALTVKYVDKYPDKIASVERNEITIYQGMMLSNRWEQIVSTIVHMIVHVILKHSFRADKWRKNVGMVITKSGKDKWEFVLNLLSDGKVGQYINKQEAYNACRAVFGEGFDKMSIEECLDKLLKGAKIMPGGAGGKGEGKLTNGQDLGHGEGKEEADAVIIQQGEESQNDEELESKINESVARGLVMQKMAGKGEGDLERMLMKELLKGKTLNWQDILLRLIGDEISKGKVGDWRRMSRKCPDIIPGLRDVYNPKVWILVDVSGSISEVEYAKFVRKMMGVTKYAEVEMVFWDDGIRERRKVKMERDMMKTSKGYGGTVLAPVLKELEKEIKANHVLAIMTDGYWGDVKAAVKILKRMRAKKVLVTTSEVIKEGFHKIVKVEQT